MKPYMGTCDLICTDPPYLLTPGGSDLGSMGGCLKPSRYKNDGNLVPCNITWQQIMEACYNLLKPNTQAYIMSNNRNLKEALQEAENIGFGLHNILVWDKGTVTPNRWYMNGLEFCLFLYKGKTKELNDMSMGNLFKAKNIKGNGHPTEKPVQLMQRWIEQSTQENDLVCDPFMGSGTTALASFSSNRKFVGCEIDDTYYELSVKRLEEHKRQGKLF
jgi:site-specific DNA-methyltransferase (adenine-specific)